MGKERKKERMRVGWKEGRLKNLAGSVPEYVKRYYIRQVLAQPLTTYYLLLPLPTSLYLPLSPHKKRFGLAVRRLLTGNGETHAAELAAYKKLHLRASCF